MKSTILLSLLVLTLPLMTSCGSGNLPKEKSESLNASALYDPPSVTLIKGRKYQFAEGVLEGRGQRFISQYAFSKSILDGTALGEEF